MTGKIRGWERQILVIAVRLAPMKLYAIKTTLPSVIVYNLDYAEGVGFMTCVFTLDYMERVVFNNSFIEFTSFLVRIMFSGPVRD